MRWYSMRTHGMVVRIIPYLKCGVGRVQAWGSNPYMAEASWDAHRHEILDMDVREDAPEGAWNLVTMGPREIRLWDLRRTRAQIPHCAGEFPTPPGARTLSVTLEGQISVGDGAGKQLALL